MNLTVEFIMTPVDMRETMALHPFPRFSLLRITVAAAPLLFSLWHWSTNGLDWTLGLFIALAIYGFFHMSIFQWLFPLYFLRTMKHPLTFRTSIGDQAVSIQQDELRQEILWSSFAASGVAREIKNHFWLECGHHGVWIPKRAFQTADDIAAFRALVKDKMGERCQFGSP